MIRGLKIAGFVVLVLVLLVVVSLGVILGTQTGSRWVLAQVPGLQVDNFNGRLGAQWSAEHRLWDPGTSSVKVTRQIVAW